MPKALVRRVDHFYVPLENAPEAFSFLTQTLDIPEVWPYTDYGLFASGGVHLGNVNMELIKSSDAFHHAKALDPARVRGIAFEPALEINEEFPAELDRRGIPHSPPIPMTPPGADAPFWTNVGFGDWQSISGTFACKYHSFDVDESRAGLRKEFDTRGGGALGLDCLEEIVFGVKEVDAARAVWQNLLDPTEPSEPGLWRLGDGPAIRLEGSEEDRVERLVLRVRSVGEAKGALGTAEELGGLVLEFID